MNPTKKDYLCAIAALLLMVLVHSLDYYWEFGW